MVLEDGYAARAVVSARVSTRLVCNEGEHGGRRGRSDWEAVRKTERNMAHCMCAATPR